MMKTILSLALCSLIFISCNDEIKKAEYSGKDMTDIATIIRDKETKQASLDIKDNTEWVLYGGTSVDKIDFRKPLAKGKGSGTYPLDINDSVRYYFQLVTPEAKAILSDSHLPMEGGYNFRDLGGIKTTNGKYIKWGKMFRSDDLNHLTESDLAYLASIPLISIVDFRSTEEIKNGFDVPSFYRDWYPKRNWYPYSISPGNIMGAIRTMDMNKVTPEMMDTLMMDMNRMLVTDSTAIEQYRKFFELAQNENEIPLLFHCSAGKDRTGMGAALFLSSLGVDENTILENYLESNTYLADKYSKYIAERPNLKPLFEVKVEFLKAGIDQIKNDHGSIENYLTNVLKVDIEKMKQIYLY
ncbi:MAG: tyrosine-protein phosphatase [Dysgonomonas sp.]|nr:tyrosine-protein phosphatase [Dysgonomonas sp.]